VPGEHPSVADVGGAVDRALLSFFRGLRRLGFTIGPEETATALQALDLIGLEKPQICRAAIQCIVVRHPEQLPLFRAAWEQFLIFLNRPGDPWLAQHTLTANIARMRQERMRRPEVIWMGGAPENVRPADSPVEDSDAPDLAVARGASREEVLRRTDFARLTPLEQREMQRTRRHLPLPVRLSRRRVRDPHGAELDLAATARAAGTAGEWFRLVRRDRKWALRPVILLCDVSGSMEPYSRMLLRFAHTLMADGVRLETFVFSTRLTRITRALRLHDPDRALEDALQLAPDFAGGTRLGEALGNFNREWARRVLRQGARVLLATDGFDTGDIEMLAREARRLARLAKGLTWLNPGYADPAYEPVTDAARVLLEAADEVVPAYSWHTLEQAWIRLAAPQKRGGPAWKGRILYHPQKERRTP
jgi:uncharacterized protein with von Willebrand factor type A (vWA) domain